MSKFKIIICAFMLCTALVGCDKTYYDDNVGYGIQYNTDIWQMADEKDNYDFVIKSLDDTAEVCLRIDKLENENISLDELNELYAKEIAYGQVSVQKIIIDGSEGILLKSEPVEEREYEPWEIRNIFVAVRNGSAYAFFYRAESEQSQEEYFSYADELLTGFMFTK